MAEAKDTDAEMRDAGEETNQSSPSHASAPPSPPHETAKAALSETVSAPVKEVDPKEEIEAILRRPDSIMNPQIVDVLRRYLAARGVAADAIKIVSKAYEGSAQMCNLVASWLLRSSVPAAQIRALADQYIHKLTSSKFDPKLADAALSQFSGLPRWFSELITDPSSRQLLYSLARAHRQSQFLTFAIRMIGAAGHQLEIASLEVAAAFFNVFSDVLSKVVHRLLQVHSATELERHLPEFISMCAHSQHTYLYATVALKQIEDDSAQLPQVRNRAVRLREELLMAAKQRPSVPRMEALLIELSGQPEDLQEALSHFLAHEELTQTHLIKLERLYKSDSPPPIQFLRRFDLMQHLVRRLFTPRSLLTAAVTLSSTFVDSACYLLAVASQRSGADQSSAEAAEVQEVDAALHQLYAFCENQYIGESFQVQVAALAPNLKIPLVSLGVLTWAQVKLRDLDWYQSQFSTATFQTMLALLKEVAFLHPFQSRHVIQLLVDVFEINPDLGPVTLNDAQKAILSLLAFLMTIDHSRLVLDAVLRWADDEMGQSLLRHFVLSVISLSASPYDTDFLTRFFAIFDRLTSESLRSTEFSKETSAFFGLLRKDPRVPRSILDHISRLETKALTIAVLEPKAVPTAVSQPKKLTVQLHSKPEAKAPSLTFKVAPKAAPRSRRADPSSEDEDSSDEAPVNHLMNRAALPGRSNAAPEPKFPKIVLKTKPQGPPPRKTGYSTRARGPAPEILDILDEIDPDIAQEKEKARPLPPPKKRKLEQAFATEGKSEKVKSGRAKKPRKKETYDAEEDGEAAVWVTAEDDDFAPTDRVRGARTAAKAAVATRTQRGAVQRKSYKELEGSSESSESSSSSDSSADSSDPMDEDK